MDGSPNPHDYLAVLGDRELQRYLVNEVQEVYRLQGVTINDKHIEIIVRQMLRRVRIEEVGDTDFVVGELVDKFVFQEENDRVLGARASAPATAKPVLLGITKASLSHRQLHLGGLLPGDHPGADRGGHQRQDGRPARVSRRTSSSAGSSRPVPGLGNYTRVEVLSQGGEAEAAGRASAGHAGHRLTRRSSSRGRRTDADDRPGGLGACRAAERQRPATGLHG